MTVNTIAILRHLYGNMVNGAVRDTASAKRLAVGLLGPAIEALERAPHEANGDEGLTHDQVEAAYSTWCHSTLRDPFTRMAAAIRAALKVAHSADHLQTTIAIRLQRLAALDSAVARHLVSHDYPNRLATLLSQEYTAETYRMARQTMRIEE